MKKQSDRRSAGVPSEPAKPPLPMHHLLRLGKTDGKTNPNGVGDAHPPKVNRHIGGKRGH